MSDLHASAAQRAQQLVLVVARDAERVAVGHHAHREPEHARDVGAAVDQVADEDERAGRRDGGH